MINYQAHTTQDLIANRNEAQTNVAILNEELNEMVRDGRRHSDTEEWNIHCRALEFWEDRILGCDRELNKRAGECVTN